MALKNFLAIHKTVAEQVVRNELLKWTSLLEIPDFAEFFSVAKRFMRP